MRFSGVIPPAITAHHADGSIDTKGVAAVLEHLISSGVHGIIIGGTTGEYYAQSKDERVQLFNLAKQVINGRVPWIAGVGAIRTEDCIEYAEQAKAAGADGILVGAPYYAVPTQLELAHHALEIDRAAKLPIMLYNYPGRTGTLMDAEFFNQIRTSSNFCSIKESSGNINHMHMLACEYPNLDLFCGMDDQALEFFVWGAKGWVCGGGNCLPEEHLALYNACVVEKDFAKGRKIMAALLPFMAVLEQGGKFVQSIKYGCSLAGLPSGPVRKPIGELTHEEKQNLSSVFTQVKSAVAAIKSARA